MEGVSQEGKFASQEGAPAGDNRGWCKKYGYWVFVTIILIAGMFVGLRWYTAKTHLELQCNITNRNSTYVRCTEEYISVCRDAEFRKEEFALCPIWRSNNCSYYISMCELNPTMAPVVGQAGVILDAMTHGVAYGYSALIDAFTSRPQSSADWFYEKVTGTKLYDTNGYVLCVILAMITAIILRVVFKVNVVLLSVKLVKLGAALTKIAAQMYLRTSNPAVLATTIVAEAVVLLDAGEPKQETIPEMRYTQPPVTARVADSQTAHAMLGADEPTTTTTTTTIPTMRYVQPPAAMRVADSQMAPTLQSTQPNPSVAAAAAAAAVVNTTDSSHEWLRRSTEPQPTPSAPPLADLRSDEKDPFREEHAVYQTTTVHDLAQQLIAEDSQDTYLTNLAKKDGNSKQLRLLAARKVRRSSIVAKIRMHFGLPAVGSKRAASTAALQPLAKRQRG